LLPLFCYANSSSVHTHIPNNSILLPDSVCTTYPQAMMLLSLTVLSRLCQCHAETYGIPTSHPEQPGVKGLGHPSYAKIVPFAIDRNLQLSQANHPLPRSTARQYQQYKEVKQMCMNLRLVKYMKM
jgi:hypothetical protein